MSLEEDPDGVAREGLQEAWATERLWDDVLLGHQGPRACTPTPQKGNKIGTSSECLLVTGG